MLEFFSVMIGSSPQDMLNLRNFGAAKSEYKNLQVHILATEPKSQQIVEIFEFVHEFLFHDDRLSSP